MTDVLQFIILTVSVLAVVPLLFVHVGGVGAFVEATPEGFFFPAAAEYSLLFLGGWMIIHFFKVGGDWAFVQRHLCVPTGKDARKSAYLFGGLLLVCPIFWMLPPMIFRTIRPEANPEQAYILACQLVLPAGKQARAQALISAAASGDLASVRTALASGLDPDVEDRNGWTPLLHALRGNHVAVARLLVDHGASLNRLAPNGVSPLSFAGNLAQLDLLREFLDLGADPNLVDPYRPHGSPLVLLMSRSPAAARLLLERGADPRTIAATHDREETLPPIFHAAARGDLAAIKLLAEFGAGPAVILWREANAGPVRGRNALHSAAASNDVATLDHFLALGLDPALTDASGANALDWALTARADRTAARLRALGVRPRAERVPPPRAN